MEKAELMPTIWQWKEATFSPLVMPHFEAVEVKKLSADAIMVATSMASSMSDAQRLVKQGSVIFRLAQACVTQDTEHTICVCHEEPRPVKQCENVFRKVKDPRDKLPEGFPVVVHCGSMGHPRMTKRMDGKPGFETWVGAVVVMIPTEGQKIEDWSEEFCPTKELIESRMKESAERINVTPNFIAAYCTVEWERQYEQQFIKFEE